MQTTYSQGHKSAPLPSILHIVIVLLAFVLGCCVLIALGIASDINH